MVFPKSWGMILLALLLIFGGMALAMALTFRGMPQVLGTAAIVAGVLILIGR